MNESELPVPTNNFEDYLSNLCGVPGELPVPRSRADIYLKYLCEHQTQGKTFVMGWKKGTTPDVTKIPAGITVTYEGQSYTGTLAASEQTTAGLYLVYNGNSTEGGIDYYDEYGTVQNADETYSWERIGGTSIDTSVVFMNEDGSTYTTMGDLRTRINAINAGHGHVFFDMSSVISGAYVCLVTLSEKTSGGATTYFCEINDLLNNKVYTTYTGYQLTDTVAAFIAAATVKGGYVSIKVPADMKIVDLYNMINAINERGDHVLFDCTAVASSYSKFYAIAIVISSETSTTVSFRAYNVFTGENGLYNWSRSALTNGLSWLLQKVTLPTYVEIMKGESWSGTDTTLSKNTMLRMSDSKTLTNDATITLDIGGDMGDVRAVKFTAGANVTVTISLRSGADTVYGDNVIHCIAGKTYLVSIVKLVASGSPVYEFLVSYVGW